METFIIYIAKSGICLGVFVIIYALFLRSTTFYRFNRFFLIAGFILSLVVPAIRYSYEVLIPSTIIDTEPVTGSNNIATADTSLSIWPILFVLYSLGIVVLVVRNIMSYRNLNSLVRNGIKSDNERYKLIENENVKSPFTVLNYILLNSQNLSETEKELILKHELTHIKQKHWLDLLCSECILILQWFNPLAWLHVHLLKENHEFLADKAVIDSGVSPALYQAVLINQRFQGPVFSFSNSFNHSKPLNRLNMIKRAKSSPWKRISALLIIPVFGLFIWASAVPRYVLLMDEPVSLVEQSVDGRGLNDTIKNKSQVYVIGAKEHVKIKLNDDNATNAEKLKNPLYIIDGKRSANGIENIKPDDIESMSVLKDEVSKGIYGEGAENGVVLITTKKSTEFSPTGLLRVTDSLNQRNNSDQRKGQVTIRSTNKDLNNVLLIVDGKMEPAEKIETIDPNTIDAIEVLKDESAIAIYGGLGKNGVIKVTTKKK